jgi:hypothetical protein
MFHTTPCHPGCHSEEHVDRMSDSPLWSDTETGFCFLMQHNLPDPAINTCLPHSRFVCVWSLEEAPSLAPPSPSQCKFWIPASSTLLFFFFFFVVVLLKCLMYSPHSRTCQKLAFPMADSPCVVLFGFIPSCVTYFSIQ